MTTMITHISMPLKGLYEQDSWSKGSEEARSNSHQRERVLGAYNLIEVEVVVVDTMRRQRKA
jgi:hypothetical protein